MAGVVTLKSGVGSGTDQAGKNLILIPGGGTGTGNSGDIILRTISGGGDSGENVNSDGTNRISVSGAGAITMTVADETDLTLGNEASDAYFKVAASATAGSEDVRIVNTNGTDEAAIAITASAGGVDIDAAVAKDVNVSGGQVALVSKDDVASAISLTTNNGTSETIVVTNTLGTDNAAIEFNSIAGGITMKVADGKDLTLGNTNSDAYFKVAASATAGSEDVRIVNTNGTDEAAIAITSTAGGVDIDAAAAKDVNVSGGQVALVSKDDAASAISLTTNVGTGETIVLTNTQGTLESAITLTSTAGGVDIDAAAAKDVNISGGQVALVSKDDAASAISLTANQGTSETIVLTNTQGTSSSAITLAATAGGVDIDAGGAVSIDSSAGSISLGAILSDGQSLILGKNGATEMVFTPHGTAANEKISLTNTAGSAVDAIKIEATTGGVDIDAGGAVSIDSTAGSITMGAILADGQTLKLGKNGATEMVFTPSDTAADEKISLTNTMGSAADAIYLNALAGGIDVDAGGNFDVDASGAVSIDSSAGSITMGAVLADGQTLKLGKNGATEMIFTPHGTAANEKISLTNTSGTESDAIALTSSAGGITLTGDITLTGNVTVGSSNYISLGGIKYNFPDTSNDNSPASGKVLTLASDGGDSSSGYNLDWQNQSSGALEDLSNVDALESANSYYILSGYSGSPPGAEASDNIALGDAALNSLAPTSGNAKENVAIGSHSGDAITTGSNNTCVGFQAGDALTTGSNNTVIGSTAAASAVDVSNEFTLGNSSVTALRCADTTIASLSDQRDKTNIVDSTYGLSFVESIRPVQFTWDRRNLVEGDINNSHNGKTRVGFIAQELQNAMPNNENEILDLVYESNPDRLEAKYGNLIPILTKAIQELKQANDALTARVAALESA